MAEAAEAVGIVAAPEVGLPLAVGQTVVAHGKPIFGGLMIAASIFFIIVAIIVIAAAKTPGAKQAGYLMLGLFALIGFGGYYFIARDKPKQA